MSRLLTYANVVCNPRHIVGTQYVKGHQQQYNKFYVYLLGDAGFTWSGAGADKARDEFLPLWKKAMDGDKKETSLKTKLIKMGLAHWVTNPKNGKPMFELKQEKI